MLSVFTSTSGVSNLLGPMGTYVILKGVCVGGEWTTIKWLLQEAEQECMHTNIVEEGKGKITQRLKSSSTKIEKKTRGWGNNIQKEDNSGNNPTKANMRRRRRIPLFV